MRGLQKAAAVLAALALFLCACPLFSTPAQAADAPPDVDAGAYVVIDAATGQVLISKNAHKQLYPASITKIMTVALALESCGDFAAHAGDEVKVSYRAANAMIPEATSIALREGEVMNLNDLLYATQVVSANDAANTVAEYTSGSIESFAQRMNDKAAALGLADTHFTNPSGLPDKSHVTSAYDMAQITAWALSVPGYRDYFSATGHEMAATNYRGAPFALKATNSILLPTSGYYYPYATGSKQGYTDDARFTLATSAARNGMELVSVVLDCPTNMEKYNATKGLLDYCFDNYRSVTYSTKDVAATQVPVYGGGKTSLGDITVLAEQDVTFLLHNSLSPEDVSARTNIPERYVIGQPFAPTVEIYISKPGAMQETVLTSAPMVWEGLDEILAANTFALDTVMESIPAPFWIVAAVLLAAILLLLARTLYVKRQRQKRQEAKLAAARMHWPAKLAERPAATPRERAAVAPASARAPSYATVRGAGNPAPRQRAGAAAAQRASLRMTPPAEHLPPRRVGQAR